MTEAEKYVFEVWKNKRDQAIVNKLKDELLNVAAWIKINEKRLKIAENEIPDIMEKALEYIIKKDKHHEIQFDERMEEISNMIREAINKTILWIVENQDWLGINSFAEIPQTIINAIKHL